MNGISHEEPLENFLILLGSRSSNLSCHAHLPTNSEALQLLTTTSIPEPESKNENGYGPIKIHETYVTVWDEKNKNQWYLAYCLKVNDDGT